MKLFDRKQAEENREEIIAAMKRGAIFIYPTDTIYGLGCNALNERSVAKICELKQREEKPFSIIAPSKSWIIDNCEINDLKKLDILPGPYTLFVKKKNIYCVAENTSFRETLGVRIPHHWFTIFVEEAGIPFVTTSVNISGEKHMETLEDVPKSIFENVDYVVYEGEKRGESSVKIDLTKDQSSG